MLTRALTVATVLLAALVVHQYRTIADLRRSVEAAETRALPASQAATAASMARQGPEIQRTMEWLNDYYKSPGGLDRADGLCIGGKPDLGAITSWVFDVYLRRRLLGDSEDQARIAVLDAIKKSDEFRTKHPAAD
jgi:hypothetical protein